MIILQEQKVILLEIKEIAMIEETVLTVHSKNAPEIGEQLKAAREKKHLSQKEVSRALCLSVSVIEKLEQEQFDQLPGAVFVQGYIRSYAEYLGIPIPKMPVNETKELKIPEPLTPEKKKTPIFVEIFSVFTRINLNYFIGLVFIVILYFAWHEKQHVAVGPASLTDLSDKVIPFKKIEVNDVENTVGIGKHPIINDNENTPWNVVDNIKNEAN